MITIMKWSSYRLIVVSGPASGQSYDLTSKSAVIGRAEDSDFVILDPKISRHHCRIYFRDQQLHLADLRSANDTLVDGNPIHEEPIGHDALITIGDSVIKVQNTAIPQPTRLKSKHVIVACILIMIALGIIIWRLVPDTPPQTEPVIVQSRNATGFAIDYWNESISHSNTLIYNLTLLPPNEISLIVHDPLSNKRLQRTAIIPDYQINLIAHQIQNAGIPSLPSQSSPIVDQFQLIRLAVFDGQTQHVVAFENTPPPAMISNICHEMEKLAEENLGGWTRDISDSNLVSLAQTELDYIRNMLSADSMPIADFYECIQRIEYARWLMNTVGAAEPLKATINMVHDQLNQSLDTEVHQNFIQAEDAEVNQNIALAEGHYQQILQLIPDSTDPRYQLAVERLRQLPPFPDIVIDKSTRANSDE